MTFTNTSNIYESKIIVQKYASLNFLFKPEKIVFNQKSNLLKNAHVLDIGVGGGRTSQWLIPICKSYIGIDVSNQMIEFCKKKFKHYKNAVFHRIDASHITDYFNNESFDFILFSFNGIDCIPYHLRDKTLISIFNILKNNGYFFYSFHNIRNLPKLFSLSLGKNFFKWFERYNRYKRLNKLYPHFKNFLKENYVSILDGSENFGIEVVYTKPEYEIEKLKEIGFSNIHIYEFSQSWELNEHELQKFFDSWIYVLCQKKL